MFDSLTVLTTSHHQHFTVLKEIQHDNKTLKGGGGGVTFGWVRRQKTHALSVLLVL